MNTQQKSLDTRIARILTNPSCRDFLLVDAKDADMAFGLAAPGVLSNHVAEDNLFRTMEFYREQICGIVADGHIDVMLMSANTNAQLTIDKQLFETSSVTPAVRMNDTTDIWLSAGTGSYSTQPALPFSTCTIKEAQYGWNPLKTKTDTPSSDTVPGANLGLFSLTLNDQASVDQPILNAYKNFRLDAEQNNFKHFLEIFYPNCLERRRQIPDLDRFIADQAVRCLAGIPQKNRPLFLKILYLRPAIMEQLAAYDKKIIIGVLGGSSGTTCDAFTLAANAKKYGARAAIFGRKINSAEDQRSFVKFLRAVIDDELSPEEAVRGYHAVLKEKSLRPKRELRDDLVQTSNDEPTRT